MRSIYPNLVTIACLFLIFPPPGRSCVDDDEEIARLAAQRGERDDITACVDILGGCSLNNQVGQLLRTVCCQTCSDNDVSNEAVETALPPTDETIQVYLLAGQSECVGQAEAADLDADPEGYPELQGDIPGVWFAGYSSPASTNRFFIAPMNAGTDRSMFGPEISFGERMHAVTGKRILMMKYCVGGTNVVTQWNPEKEDNSWDASADDGSAQWMAENAGLNFNSKTHLFKNMVYTIRRTNEALTDGGVPYEWAGIVWVQGQGDLKFGDWSFFGENTARVWDGFREHVGSDVPVIDTGSSTHNQLKSGKEYAAQLVKGCKAKNVEFAMASNDDTLVNCTLGPGNLCAGTSSIHVNLGPSLYYGYDPAFPDSERNCQDCKEFRWYRKYPVNLHSGYEGMILKGRMLANAFLREFTNYTIPTAFTDDDPAVRFPWDRCPGGTLPSDGNFCWIDYRNESVMRKPISELCTEDDSTSNEDIPSNSDEQTANETTDDDSAAVMSSQGLGMILRGIVGVLFFLW